MKDPCFVVIGRGFFSITTIVCFKEALISFSYFGASFTVEIDLKWEFFEFEYTFQGVDIYDIEFL